MFTAGFSVHIGKSHVQEGETALIWSSENGHTECVRLLVEASANTEAKENVRDTIFRRLVSFSRIYCWQWLTAIFEAILLHSFHNS